ncbi:SMI1/KNR4 family protein [Nonomuraea sp. NPDC048826]|uniref:SMI1/KNR4 family protein n=1 Tax=Nonomuraea sp. NPDC048826 TaxID=3364347 RepID=UPI00371B5CD7
MTTYGSGRGWSELFPAEGPNAGDLERGLHPPAGEQDVRRLEERLGVGLPRSYRQFLLFADGWGADDYAVWPAAKVGWLRDLDPHLIEVCSPPEEEGSSWSVPDDLYFVYGEEQDCVNLRPEYLPDTLLVGRWDDGEFLLNPRVTTPDGEWEAWYIAPWLAGAIRHRSFWDLMEDRMR